MPCRDRVDVALEARENLKRVAHELAQVINVPPVHRVFRVLSESRCSQKWRHGKLAVKAKLSRKREGESNPSYFEVSIGETASAFKGFFFKQSPAVAPDMATYGSDGIKSFADEAVLVGIREPMDGKERMRFRVWLFVERLKVPDFVQAVDDTTEAALRKGRRFVPNPVAVFDLVSVDRELVVARNWYSTGDRESRNDIVESAPETLECVPCDQPESVAMRWKRNHPNVGPTIWFDLADPHGVRVRLIDDSGEFSLVTFVVEARPCDLCDGPGKV